MNATAAARQSATSAAITMPAMAPPERLFGAGGKGALVRVPVGVRDRVSVPVGEGESVGVGESDGVTAEAVADDDALALALADAVLEAEAEAEDVEVEVAVADALCEKVGRTRKSAPRSDGEVYCKCPCKETTRLPISLPGR